MNKSIKASTFMTLLGSKLNNVPFNSRIKTIGTTQDDFIILVEDPNGKEYKLYIECEEKENG